MDPKLNLPPDGAETISEMRRKSQAVYEADMAKAIASYTEIYTQVLTDIGTPIPAGVPLEELRSLVIASLKGALSGLGVAYDAEGDYKGRIPYWMYLHNLRKAAIA